VVLSILLEELILKLMQIIITGWEKKNVDKGCQMRTIGMGEISGGKRR